MGKRGPAATTRSVALDTTWHSSSRRKHRIVAKVDELMAVCDGLEAGLVAGEDTCDRLLEALLHEALAPVDVQEEAA